MFDFLFRALAEEASPTDTGAASEAAPGWFQTAFKKFGEFPVWGWAVVAALLIGGIALYAAVRKQRKSTWNTRMMAVGAICMALASVLSLIRLWKMPMGGAVTPASMLPLLLFAYIYGAGPGITLGALYGVMQFILDGGEFAWAGLLPNLLDYPIAFGLLGLCGLFSKGANQQRSMMTGIVVGCFGRFVASFLSGWIFYGQYAPEGWNPIWYAISYNGTYLLPECIICIVLAALIGPRLVRELRKVA